MLTEEKLRQAIDTAIDGMIVIDHCGTVLLYNAACERLFGYEATEVLGHNVNMLMPAPDSERHDTYLKHFLRTGEAKIIGIGRDVQGRRKDASSFPMRLSVGQVGEAGDDVLFVGTIHDLTEGQRARERIEELQSELMRVSRASALGEMGSTLAHELNQPLSAIAGFVEASAALIEQSEVDLPPRVVELMTKAVAQTHRAGDVIRRLREFTRKGDTDRAVENINTVVEETCALATLGSTSEGINVTQNLAPDLPPVMIDSIQIQQVILNLVRNSIDAVIGCDVRDILVGTARCDEMIEVAVSDTGPGLAPSVQQHLFEPFVSTKPDGIGIGLSICRTIIDSHGGDIRAEAREGGGAIFRFTVPTFDGGND